MMRRPLLSICLGLLLLAHWQAAAQESAAPSAAASAQTPRSFTGEIIRLTEGGFEIKPWKVEHPRRVQVMVPDGARLLEQKRGKLPDVQVGDLVLVVAEDP